jgi:hypothetical protein
MKTRVRENVPHTVGSPKETQIVQTPYAMTPGRFEVVRVLKPPREVQVAWVGAGYRYIVSSYSSCLPSVVMVSGADSAGETISRREEGGYEEQGKTLIKFKTHKKGAKESSCPIS